jgi:Leucine-rich repeat (LRR) protein
MPIFINYNLEQNPVKYNSFDKIRNYNYILHINCSDNQLTSLPKLPNSLQILYCYDNQLTSLPELPDSLEILFCYNNQLTYLPELPNSFLEIFCQNDNIIKKVKYSYLYKFF